MFDKIIDVLLQCVGWFIPFVVIDEYERGVVLRFGRRHRVLQPGFHWIVPLEVEKVLSDNVVARPTDLKAQALTTKDAKSIVVRAVVTSCIRDIEKALLECEGVDNALEDSCIGAIGDLVAAHTWDEIQQPSFTDALTKACRKQAWRYGIEIQRVQLADRSLSRTFRFHTT